MRIFVLGGTGAVGRPLVPRLVAAGHEVTGAARSDASERLLRELGATPVRADILDAASLDAALSAAKPEAVIHQATSLRGLMTEHAGESLAATGAIRGEGTRSLIDAANRHGVRRFVVQSIAFAYAPGRGPVDEDWPLYLEAPPGRRALAATINTLEEMARTSGMEASVLRYGTFYGPGTLYEPHGPYPAMLRGGRVRISGEGRGYTSFIHVDDAASAAVAALDGPPGTWNIVDDEPAMASEWIPAVAEVIGAPPPPFIPLDEANDFERYQMDGMPAVSNARAKQHLGWTPQHPTWRTSLLSALRGER